MWRLNNHPFVWGKRLIQPGFSLTGLLNGLGGKQREKGSGIFPYDFRPWIFLFQWPQQDEEVSWAGLALLDVSGWAVVGQLGSRRSGLVLPSVLPHWPVWSSLGVPDGICSLWGAEIGNSAGFNPTQPTVWSPAVSLWELPSGHLCLLQCYWKCLSLERSGQRNGGSFWEEHRLSTASAEGYGRDFWWGWNSHSVTKEPSCLVNHLVLMKTLSVGLGPRRCLGTRCFLSVSAWLPCAPDHGNSPVINSFLGINVFSS